MHSLQLLSEEPQAIPAVPRRIDLSSGQLLGNPRIQVSVSFAELPLHQFGVEHYRVFQRRLELASPGNRLAALKALHFPIGEKNDRIRRSLAALNSQPNLRLSASQWKNAADAADFEEE